MATLRPGGAAALLPLLREELDLLPGPVLADGQSSHTLHDPVRNRYFQIDWPTFEVLKRWHLGHASIIADSISGQTTLQLQAHDVEEVVAFCRDNQLLQPRAGSAAEFAGRLRSHRGSATRWLLHHYLFFRIPLVKPDRWLGRWAPRLGFLFTPAFLWLTLAALFLGVVQACRQWDHFTATLVDTLSGSGVISYGFTLAAVKVLHELGHAITAKRLGCKVPAMGVAFLMMCPVAYTDTNDVWRLTSRRQRLAVAAAGVLTELTVAAWATLAWGLLPDGTARSMAFLLAAVTWTLTLAINASPFMRFDGYFLLSDALGMPNLHDRAFALARWDLRERLFGLGATPPEDVPPTRRTLLVLFAYATWAYRLAVFLGIAALVYAFFIKAVGIFLFAVEIVWFVLRPLWQETRAWHRLWPALKHRARTWRSAGLLALLGLLLLVPWPLRLAAGGLLRPTAQFVVYAPAHAQVVALPVVEGRHVEAGALLVELASPDLHSRLDAARARADSLRWLSAAGAFDREQRSRWLVSREQLHATEAEIATLEADSQRFAPTAPYAGTLRDLAPDLRPGTWLGANEVLARLVADQGQTAVAYVDEEDVGRIAVGDTAKFYADAPGGPVVRLEVAGIDSDSTRVLPEPELSTAFGGSVLVREKNGQYHTERPLYRVNLKPVGAVDDAAGQHTWRGRIVVEGRWASPAWHYLRSAAAVVRREAGF